MKLNNLNYITIEEALAQEGLWSGIKKGALTAGAAGALAFGANSLNKSKGIENTKPNISKETTSQHVDSVGDIRVENKLASILAGQNKRKSLGNRGKSEALMDIQTIKSSLIKHGGNADAQAVIRAINS